MNRIICPVPLYRRLPVSDNLASLTSGPITGSILLGLCILMVQGLVNSFGIGYYLVKHRKETL